MRLIISLLILFPVSYAMAAPKTLPNFQAGKYSLTEGPAEKCGEGDFKMRDDGQGVQFGALQGFNSHTSNVVLNSDIPEEKDCVYDVREKAVVRGKETTLTFAETLRCPGNVRHILDRKATISAGRVVLEIDQKGNPEFGDDELTFKYSCVFTKK